MKDSLETVTYWRNELKESGEDLVIVVLGNKIDAEKEREISTESGRLLAESLGALFEETSAVTGANVEAIFFKAAKRGWEKKKEKEIKRVAGVSLNDDGQTESKCAC
jgi:GTPase SAR1 family protein